MNLRTIAAPIAALLFATTGAAYANNPVPERTVMGLTTWDCDEPAPETWIDRTQPPRVQRLMEIHEADHREQLMSFGSCEAFHRALREYPSLRLTLEAHAFARQAEAMHRLYDVPLDYAIRKTAWMLAGAYPFGLTEEEAANYIRVYVRVPSDPAV